MSNNVARHAGHDAAIRLPGGKVVGFNREWTRRAVRLLRAVAKNPFIRQKRNGWGGLDAEGHGQACANQVLIDLLDSLRTDPNNKQTIDKILPVTHHDIIGWNDSAGLTFEQIAAKIETAAGGAEALQPVPDGAMDAGDPLYAYP